MTTNLRQSFAPGPVVESAAFTTARLLSITEVGEPVVVIAGLLEPVVIKTAIRFDSRREAESHVGEDVLVLLANDDIANAVMLGFVGSSLCPGESTDFASASRQDAKLSAERVLLEGEREIVLRCGKSRIHLKRDGTLTVNGTKISSRATRINRIRGPSVNIN